MRRQDRAARRLPRAGHRRGRTERGQGMVEFALVAPVLLMLVFGVFDFGRALSNEITVTNSARDGARYIAGVASAGGTVSASSYLTTNADGYSTNCPNASGSSAPESSDALGKAWRQLEAANLDLSKVVVTAYFYAATNTNDPAADGGHTHADMRISCWTNDTPGTAPSTVQTTYPGGNSSYVPASGDMVVVVAAYQYSPSTPAVATLVHTVTVQESTTMVVE